MAKKASTVDLSFLGADQPRTDLSTMFQAASSELEQARLIKIERLRDNPYQPRGSMDETRTQELASVIKAQGFQGVLVARRAPSTDGYYELAFGHRRRDAAKLANLSVLPVVVRELSDRQMVAVAITENIQREDLTPLEEGRTYLLMAGEMGYTHEQIASEVGKARGYIENRIRIARAPHDVQRLVEQRPDTIRAVATLVKVKDEALRGAAITEILAGSLTTDDLPGYLATWGSGISEEAASPGEKKRRQGRRSSSETSSDERTLSRVGGAKLETALRSLLAYRETLRKKGLMTSSEAGSLAQIAALVDELLSNRQGLAGG